MLIEIDKIGSDAEVFLIGPTGQSVPVVGLVGGTKENPLPVPSLGEGFAVQEDNVMLEFNIPPASTEHEFSSSMKIMLKYLKEQMKLQGLEIAARGFLNFNINDLQSEQARKFGCEPDYNVWAQSVNSPPEPRAYSSRFSMEPRCAGFHIHVSYTVDKEPRTIATMEHFVKAMDLFLGMPSVLIEPGSDRRYMYGRAGCFRPKPYGHEYRVLGSGVLQPAYLPWIFGAVHDAATFCNKMSEVDLHHFWKMNREIIQHSINEGDKGTAEIHCQSCAVKLPYKSA